MRLVDMSKSLRVLFIFRPLARPRAPSFSAAFYYKNKDFSPELLYNIYPMAINPDGPKSQDEKFKDLSA